MEFENLKNEENKPVSKEKQNNLEEIVINNVSIFLNSDPDEDFTKILTIEDLLKLDKKKPGIIINIEPKLYSAFKSSVNGVLEPYVAKGDKVRYKKEKLASSTQDWETIHTVEEVELSSIGSMSIFNARLSNGEICLTNYLKKV